MGEPVARPCAKDDEAEHREHRELEPERERHGGESPRKTITHNARPLGTWARCLVIPKTSATEHIVQARIADAAKPVIATYTISAATSMALRTRVAGECGRARRRAAW